MRGSRPRNVSGTSDRSGAIGRIGSRAYPLRFHGSSLPFDDFGAYGVIVDRFPNAWGDRFARSRPRSGPPFAGTSRGKTLNPGGRASREFRPPGPTTMHHGLLRLDPTLAGWRLDLRSADARLHCRIGRGTGTRRTLSWVPRFLCNRRGPSRKRAGRAFLSWSSESAVRFARARSDRGVTNPHESATLPV